MNIGIVIKDAGGAVLHAVEAPFAAGVTLEKLLQTAVQDTPEIKPAVLQVVALSEAVGAAGASAAAGDGINVAADIATFNAIAELYSYVRGTFVPLVKKVWGDVQTDLKPSDTATSGAAGSPVGAEPPATSGPGLHAVTAP